MIITGSVSRIFVMHDADEVSFVMHRTNVSFVPSNGVVAAARRGLELYDAGFGGRGLRPETIAWARKVARGEPINAAKAIQGNAWHARHAVDRRPGWHNPPTPGYVAYLLWFGEPGRAWFAKLTRQIRREHPNR